MERKMNGRGISSDSGLFRLLRMSKQQTLVKACIPVGSLNKVPITRVLRFALSVDHFGYNH